MARSYVRLAFSNLVDTNPPLKDFWQMKKITRMHCGIFANQGILTGVLHMVHVTSLTLKLLRWLFYYPIFIQIQMYSGYVLMEGKKSCRIRNWFMHTFSFLRPALPQKVSCCTAMVQGYGWYKTPELWSFTKYSDSHHSVFPLFRNVSILIYFCLVEWCNCCWCCCCCCFGWAAGC